MQTSSFATSTPTWPHHVGSITATLRAALERAEPDARTVAELLAHWLIREAIRGNHWALREILDRTEGKPGQAVPVVSDNDATPTRVIEIEYVDDWRRSM